MTIFSPRLRVRHYHYAPHARRLYFKKGRAAAALHARVDNIKRHHARAAVNSVRAFTCALRKRRAGRGGMTFCLCCDRDDAAVTARRYAQTLCLRGIVANAPPRINAPWHNCYVDISESTTVALPEHLKFYAASSHERCGGPVRQQGERAAVSLLELYSSFSSVARPHTRVTYFRDQRKGLPGTRAATTRSLTRAGIFALRIPTVRYLRLAFAAWRVRFPAAHAFLWLAMRCLDGALHNAASSLL